MTVTIAKNIKKERIFINKNGERITEDKLFNNTAGNMEQSSGSEGGGSEEESKDVQKK